MFEHPATTERVQRERFEERIRKADARRARAAQMDIGPAWRRGTASALRHVADSLDSPAMAAKRGRGYSRS